MKLFRKLSRKKMGIYGTQVEMKVVVVILKEVLKRWNLQGKTSQIGEEVLQKQI